VLLVARRAAGIVERAWQGVPSALESRLEILINGHPAAVLVGGRP
jgi:hypothetical protein